MKKLNNKSLFINQKGSSLMMAMISAVIIGAMAFYLMQSKKTAVFNQNKEATDRDVDRAAEDLAGNLASPANCNATFANLSISTSSANLNSINRCSTALATCYPGTANNNPVATFKLLDTSVPANKVKLNDPTTWQLFVDSALETDSKGNARPYSRVLMTKANYRLVTPQATRSGSVSEHPATVQLTVQFTKLMGRNPDGSAITAMSRDFNFDIYVITGVFWPHCSDNTYRNDYANCIANGKVWLQDPAINPVTGAPYQSTDAGAAHLNPSNPTTIIGCALNAGSTIPYGSSY